MVLLAACGGPRQVQEFNAQQQLTAEGSIDSGKQTGELSLFLRRRQTASQRHLQDDLQHGEWIGFYDNGGEQYRGDYRDGLRRHGWWRYSHATGSLQALGEHQKDRQHGPWVFGDDTGKLTGAGAFIDGVQAGVWLWYAADGTIARWGTYIDGDASGVWSEAGGVRVSAAATLTSTQLTDNVTRMQLSATSQQPAIELWHRNGALLTWRMGEWSAVVNSRT